MFVFFLFYLCASSSSFVLCVFGSSSFSVSSSGLCDSWFHGLSLCIILVFFSISVFTFGILLFIQLFSPPPSRPPIVLVFLCKITHLHLSEWWSCSCWYSIHHWTINCTSWGKDVIMLSTIFAESVQKRWTICFETVLFWDGNSHFQFGHWSFEIL
jgi:hypothetical protein